MNPRYPLVALRARHRCKYYHAPEAVFNSLLEVEHISRTLISRATVARLEINSEAQVGARQHWMRLGFFP
jgi:hypothetical protein